MKKIVVLTGAGISAESGIKTFRDSDGLWEEYRIEDVATADAWKNTPEKVVEFCNLMKSKSKFALPNEGHIALKKLEDYYDVQIITQNVDDLHERGGSTNVLHVHGEINKVRSVKNSNHIYELESDLIYGTKNEFDELLRPHIVLFGEQVPNIKLAVQHMKRADIVLIIGTSFNVYPFAGLLEFVKSKTQVYFINPNFDINEAKDVFIIKEPASIGVPKVVEKLIAEHK